MLSTEEFQAIWDEEPIVVIDTNVLLNLYRWSAGTSEQILENLNEIIDSLWIPNQVINEFRRHKDKVRNQSFNKYKNVTLEVNRTLKNTHTELSKKFLQYGKYKFPKIKELATVLEEELEKLKKVSEDFKDSIADEIQSNVTLLSNDEVTNLVDTLTTDGRVGREFSFQRLLEIYEEGDRRYKYKIPPGYKDEEEKGEFDLRKFGDLILWKETLEKSVNEGKKPLIFITEDVKPDWWEINADDELVGPRKELIKEFSDYVGINVSFNMFTLSEFNTYISVITGTNPSRAWVEMNIEEVSMDFIDDDSSRDYLQDQIMDFLVSSGELNRFLSGGLTGDVEVISLYVDLNLESISMDVEGDKITVEGIIHTKSDIAVENMYSQHYSVNNDGLVEIDMNFELNFLFNFDENSIENNEFVNYEEFEFEVENLELTSASIEDGEEYEVEFCVLCDERPGQYSYINGGLVCENCTSSNDTCPDCGVVYQRGTMHGAYCGNCEANH
ncbi:MAG: PIN-like domain-containing protein [Bacillota bacterium]